MHGSFLKIQPLLGGLFSIPAETTSSFPGRFQQSAMRPSQNWDGSNAAQPLAPSGPSGSGPPGERDLPQPQPQWAPVQGAPVYMLPTFAPGGYGEAQHQPQGRTIYALPVAAVPQPSPSPVPWGPGFTEMPTFGGGDRVQLQAPMAAAATGGAVPQLPSDRQYHHQRFRPQQSQLQQHRPSVSSDAGGGGEVGSTGSGFGSSSGGEDNSFSSFLGGGDSFTSRGGTRGRSNSNAAAVARTPTQPQPTHAIQPDTTSQHAVALLSDQVDPQGKPISIRPFVGQGKIQSVSYSVAGRALTTELPAPMRVPPKRAKLPDKPPPEEPLDHFRVPSSDEEEVHSLV